MAGGRTQFEQVVAQAPRVKLKFVQSILSTTVAAGQTENVDFFSSSNTFSEVVAIFISIDTPPTATAGTHYMMLLNGSAGAHFTSGVSKFSDIVRFDNSTWSVATDSRIPTDDASIIQSVMGIKFDSSLPLRVSYTNGTDAEQTNPRVIVLTVKETQIVG